MVNAAEADVICPAVAAEDPYGLLGEVILLSKDLLCVLAAASLKSSDQRVGSGAVGLAVVIGLQPLLACLNDSLVLAVCNDVLSFWRIAF